MLSSTDRELRQATLRRAQVILDNPETSSKLRLQWTNIVKSFRPLSQA
jgi:hypothetical protein